MDTSSPMRLSAETALYEANKSAWLQKHRDQFVVIKGEDLLGFFAEFHSAYTAGVEKYGIGADFLVKRVVAQEPVFVVF